VKSILSKIIRKVAPKVVFDRTSLDTQISTLQREKQELLAKVAALSTTPPKFHEFMGYQIPVDLMLLTGGGPENFDIISAGHTANLQRWIGLASDHTVLEIGCGIGRDAIPLTKILSKGRYVGIDIIGRSIDWCNNNIAARNKNFSFYHYNVEDQLHNSSGTTRTTDIRIPLEDGSVDSIFLFSVFTHLYRSDIVHYLKEFRRVLKPEGMIFATTFIYDDATLQSARSTNLTPWSLYFEHELEPGCRINDLAHPLGAIAYTRDAWWEMIEQGGLQMKKPTLMGGWSGLYPDAQDGQDVLLLGKK
jgi:SAM-dependent methyltransferase